MKTTAKITLATTIAIVIGVAASLGFYITKNYLKKRDTAKENGADSIAEYKEAEEAYNKMKSQERIHQMVYRTPEQKEADKKAWIKNYLTEKRDKKINDTLTKIQETES